ncbi:hypothetical protein E2C01_062070 [Portunus trituberculatus]|uniref:Wsv440-like protein n=1 Tax=Portunus trituberculatus TaxID=210409 RepID=A0A5B7HH09_PORTR|nr:hypothetical protein [Portunus trituberculatus]
MAIDARTAEKLVRWYTGYACPCPLSNRVSRVLGSLGGGIDAAYVRSRPNLEEQQQQQTTANDKRIPSRITTLIEGVLLERAMMKPDLAASAFDVRERLVYCACNNIKGNFDVSSMAVWGASDPRDVGGSGGIINVTCPSCTMERLSSPALATSRHHLPISLISFFGSLAEKEVFPERAELKKLYSVLLAGSATGGGGVYNDSCQQSSFNGSWTCLLVYSDTGGKKNTKLEAEVLVSNKIKHSSRLQPKCVCSDLLYAVLSNSGASEFAYQAANISVIEGGEFLYFTYVLFEEGGPFDNKTDLKALLKNEPTSETTCLQAAVASSTSKANADSSFSSSDEEITAPSPVRFKQPAPVTAWHTNTNMNTNNEVDMQMLLFTVLNSKGSGGGGKRGKRGGGLSQPPAKKRKKDVAATNDPAAVLDTEEDNTATTSATKKDFILPCPQIEEHTMFSQQRINALNNTDASVFKHPVTMNGTVFTLPVRQHRRKYVIPVDNVLFSPPVISRTGLNKFRVLSGLSSFFDRTEIVCTGTSDSVAMGNNTAHSAILRLLSYIRENSLKRSVELASTKGVHFVVKTPTTIIDVPISVKEIRERQLCTASTLGMLAGLAN